MSALPTSTTSTGFASPLYGAGFLAHVDTLHDAANRPRYWPSDLLGEFMLQMAGHGCCVNESMMLGSREYAIEKLTHAHTLGDDSLRELAVRMFTYFDDEPCHAAQAFASSGKPATALAH